MHAWVWKCALVCTVFVGVGLALLTLAFQLLSNDDIQDQTPTRLQAYVRFQMLLIASWVSFMVALFGGMYWFRHTRSNPHPTAFLALTGTFTFLKGREWKCMTMFGRRLNGTARNLLYFFYWAGAVAMGGLLVAYMIDDDITSVCMDDYDCFIVSPDAKLPKRANCTITPSLSPPYYFDCRRLMQFSLQQVGMSIGATYGIFCTTLRVINAVMFVVGHSSHESTGVKKTTRTTNDEETGDGSSAGKEEDSGEEGERQSNSWKSRKRKAAKRRDKKRGGRTRSTHSSRKARRDPGMHQRKQTHAAATTTPRRSMAESVNRGDDDDAAVKERFGDTREWQTVDNRCFEGSVGYSVTTTPTPAAAAARSGEAEAMQRQDSGNQSGKSRHGGVLEERVARGPASIVNGRQLKSRISSGAWDVSEAEEAAGGVSDRGDGTGHDGGGGKRGLDGSHVERDDACSSGVGEDSEKSDDDCDKDNRDEQRHSDGSLGLEWIMFFVVNGMTLALVVLYLALGILTDVIEHPGIVGMFFTGLCTMMVMGLAGVGVITVCSCCFCRRRHALTGYTLIADARA